MKQLLYLVLMFFVTYSQSFGQDYNFDTTNLIVRFNFKLLDWSLVDDVRTFDTPVGDLLNSQGKEILSGVSMEGFDFSNVTAHKIFPRLQTEDSISISRQGKEVPIPPFWATFRLEVPDGVGYYDFIEEIYDLYPLVIYSHPNFYIELESLPNDTLLGLQSSLWNNGTGAAHINIDGAWDVKTGSNFIKVGVFDTGIDTSHLDLEVLTGWSASQYPLQIGNSIVINHYGTDDRNHGTKVAGIIGAKRNNTTGIAGIAGGDGSDTSGVQLLDFRFAEPGGADIALIEDLSSLIIDAARAPGTYYDWVPELSPNVETYFEDHYTNAPGYGIQIGNNSYGYRLGLPAKNEDDPSGGGVPGGYFEDCNLCKESFLFSLKNGVINVASSGNKITESGLDPLTYDAPNIYPASYHDTWGIRVGASQYDGDPLISGVNEADNWFSIWADNVDIIAPGSSSMVESTWGNVGTYNPNDEEYGTFDGTSAAAPHVSGVVALLLSHYNKPCYSHINLDLADVEYILEHSAVPTSYNPLGDHHNGAGFGLLDATAAMDMIAFPEYQIVHPQDTFIDQQTISVDTLIVYNNKPLNGGSFGPYSTQWQLQNFRPYKVVRYEEQLTYDFSQFILDTTELLDVWVRHSETNALQPFIDTTVQTDTIQGIPVTAINVDNFDIEPMAYIDTIINDSIIKLTGYYYHFILKYDNEEIDSVNSAPTFVEDYWYPINPFVDTAKMAYSIYLRDTTLIDRYDFDCYADNPLLDSFAIVNTNSLDIISVYPNPASTELNVSLGNNVITNGKIQLIDISGRLVDEISLTNSNLYTFNIERLKSGIYFVNLIGIASDSVLTKKWIKQ